MRIEFPTLAAGEVAFRVQRDGVTSDAYASAAALVAGENLDGATIYYAEGPEPVVIVDAVTADEVRRMARAEARAAGFPGAVMRQIGENLDTLAAGPTACAMRESDDHSAVAFLDGLATATDGFRRANADRTASGLAAMLYEAQRLEYRLGQSSRRRDALESAVRRMCEAGAMTTEQRADLDGSPIVDGRHLADDLDLLRNASPGNVGERVGGVIRSALALHAAALDKMGEAREAVERSHKLAGEAAEYRRQRDAEGARAAKAEAGELKAFGHAKALVGELGGWTLDWLPANSYAAALVGKLAAARRDLGL